MLKATFHPYTLQFFEEAITSRSTMKVKDTFIVELFDSTLPELKGIGECALFRGLSAEDTPDYEAQLAEACCQPDSLPPISSIRFGFETAFAQLKAAGGKVFTDNAFTRGEEPIKINGLVWMGSSRQMKARIRAKLDAGFSCVKLKIGGIDFNDELSLLRMIRKEFSPDDLELRVDANGAFAPSQALERLKWLSDFYIHSIEQPIRANQWEQMAQLCKTSPIAIALDEELIGFRSDADKVALLDAIQPQYIILKPSLCGGFNEADTWIKLAEDRHIGWWATSALESNIGLNAIAQWVANYHPTIPQGLGTGALYANNFSSPLTLIGENLWFTSNN